MMDGIFERQEERARGKRYRDSVPQTRESRDEVMEVNIQIRIGKENQVCVPGK